MRKSIYFGRRDKDITILFNGLEDKHGEVGDLIKDLMRDGIKYREGGKAIEVVHSPNPVFRDEPKAEVVMLPAKGMKAKIGSKSVEIDQKELERRLDRMF